MTKQVLKYWSYNCRPKRIAGRKRQNRTLTWKICNYQKSFYSKRI